MNAVDVFTKENVVANNITMELVYSGFNITQISFDKNNEILKNRTGGMITKNFYLRNYIPDNELTNKTISLAQMGTPMIIFGNGNPPKVMIIAGIHGNELPAQIAAIKMINFLNNKEIKGTVYIVPWASPYSTSKNQRLWKDQNLNRIADEPGTPSNQILKRAKQLGIDRLGDFHSTQPGSYPGKTSVLCSKEPLYESYNMASYISNQTDSSLIFFDKAGVEYPGAVEDMSNLAGIPALTCEVLSPHGTATPETIERSFNQMLALLKYVNVI